MTVNDDSYPPLVYTIQGKHSSMKLEVRSILYGYLNYQANEPRYQETWEEFLDLTCQDLMDIVMETTDISYEECLIILSRCVGFVVFYGKDTCNNILFGSN